MNTLKIKNLSKTYPNGVKALENINLEIKSGMFGLLGPNGAGKSTLMRTIATLQTADQGSIHYNDVDVLTEHQNVRQILGFLPQEFNFYPKVKAIDMLEHFAVLKGISSKKERKEIMEHLLVKTNLWSHRKKKVGGFSGGMKQRLGIAQALLGNPELVIVDEPTAGLDPKERIHFHNLLSEIGEDKIVILSTHIVDDVADLCTEMAIINNGQLKKTGNPIEEIQKLEGKVWRKVIEKNELPKYADKYQILFSRLYVGKLLIHCYSDQDLGQDFERIHPSLEDVYFHTIPTHANILEG